MSDVFISYKSEDRNKAEPLAEGLKARGLTVWWDAALEGGQDYQRVIETELRAALVVMVLWTPASVQSRWVRSEATVADRQGVLLPVRLVPCEAPVAFELVQTVDLTRWSGDYDDAAWKRFAEAVEKRVRTRQREVESANPPEPIAVDELEALFWSSIRDSRSVSDFDSYLSRYPEGHFAGLAWARKARLRNRQRMVVIGSSAALVAILVGVVLWNGKKTDETVTTPQPPAAKVPVPDLKGLPVEAAVARLKESGLEPGRRTFLTLGGYAPGQLYNQAPQAGARVERGTPIELKIVREKAPDIQSSGRVALSPSGVWNLDGGPFDKQSIDIVFETGNAGQRQLSPGKDTTMGAVDRGAAGPKACEGVALATAPVQASVGAKVCVRTNGNRWALVTMVDLGKELLIDFDTWQSPVTAKPTTGGDVVVLRAGDSRRFSTGESGKYTGGDFYFHIDKVGAAMFFANNQGQRGVVSLGDVGSLSLVDVQPPLHGYYKYGVPVVESHTYVALARQGEEGHFVIFRVEAVTANDVTVRFAYR